MRALSYGLGQQYFDERDYRNAIRSLLPVVEETPDDVGTRLLLARAYFHSALLKPAEEHLREILDRAPTESYAHLMMARTLERQSRHEEASKHRRIAAALTGDDSLLASHSLRAQS
ncbi:tetratricopeptide repeat protein [Kribbella sp. NPDC023855]|uniref:tetratricopeptide repeat protein n=1 Tax=Kribbella sp. NPDC023855 TaxID=3154698 RepID=UPI0033D8E1DC